MAATIDVIKTDLQGTIRAVYANITLDSSYPTGGEAVDIGLDTIHSAHLEPDDGYIFKYDYTNNKILAYYADYDDTADGALIEVAAAVDLSNVVIRCKFEGQ